MRIAVRQGWWRLFRVQDPKHRSAPATVCAELATDIEDVLLPGTSVGGVATVSVGRATVADMEEVIGFAIPEPAADALLRSVPRLVGAAAGRTVPVPRQLTQIMRIPALRDDYLPWRASRVDLAGQPPTSYGRLRHTDPALRSWVSPEIRLEVMSAGADHDQFGLTVREVTYRIWHDGRIVLSDRVLLNASMDPRSDQAIRALVARPRSDDSRPGVYSSNRSEYYGWVRDQLRLLVAKPREPFVRGTRVHLDPRLEIASPSGTVLGRTESGNPNSGAPATYLVRPDATDLPGHHWQHLPRCGVRLPGWALRPTLTGPDPGLPASTEPRPLAFGARIRSIDDPVVDEATVLRTHLRAGKFVVSGQVS